MKKSLGLLLLLGAFVFLVLNKPAHQVLHSGETMGTTYHVKWVTSSRNTQFIREGIEFQLNDVNAKMSTYLPDSELSRFNALVSNEWFEISAETQTVIGEALRIAVLSGGAFDPTVGPLVELWGFGAKGDRFDPPADSEIESLLQQVGFEKIGLRRENPAVRKSKKALAIDLSAIAKGYAVDRIANYLAEQGIKHYMVEVGGEVRASGHNGQKQVWRIAVENPGISERPDSPMVTRVLPLLDLAMATSGTYRNYFDAQGKRYSHTLNPNTGRPIEHNTVSVSVFHPSCMTADALATALLVLGAEQGLDLAEEQGLAALFLEQNGDKIEPLASTAFQSLFESAEAL